MSGGMIGRSGPKACSADLMADSGISAPAGRPVRQLRHTSARPDRECGVFTPISPSKIRRHPVQKGAFRLSKQEALAATAPAMPSQGSLCGDAGIDTWLQRSESPIGHIEGE